MLKPSDLPLPTPDGAWKHDEEKIDALLRLASQLIHGWPCKIAVSLLRAPRASIDRYTLAGWTVVIVSDGRDGDYFEIYPPGFIG